MQPTSPPSNEREQAQLDNAMQAASEAYRDRRALDARNALDKIFSVRPQYPPALGLLAHLQLEDGDFDASLLTAQRCLAIDESRADCWLAIAVISEDRKLFAGAYEAWKGYLRCAPEGPYATHGEESLVRLRARLAH